MDKRLCEYLLIFFLLWVTYKSVRVLYSGLITVNIKEEIIKYEKKNKYTIENEKSLITRLERSIEISKNNVNSRLYLARLYILLSRKRNESQSLVNAKRLLEINISVTPTNYINWVYLVKTIDYEKQPDEHKSAIIKAIYLGKYESETQQVLIPTIFKVWGIMNENEKKETKKMLTHALNNYAYADILIKNAKKYKKLEIILEIAKNPYHIARIEKYINHEKNQ
ncbi:MAG: hypothetical protein ABF331_02730 [Hellea sp.]